MLGESKMEKFNCPNCAKGNIVFKTILEIVKDNSGKINNLDIRVGICENCKEKIYPKESAMIIERIRKPNLYSLELPNAIVDKLVLSANKKGMDFKRYALEKLAE
jgi:hypothetical protein